MHSDWTVQSRRGSIKTMIKKPPSTMKHCEIVTRLYDDDGNVLFDMDALESILERPCIQKWAYIIHNQCTYEEKEIKKDSKFKAGDLKPEHIHLALRFDAPQQLKYIARWFNIEPNFIERIKSTWSKTMLYLPHLNAPDKFQYEISEVKANFDYETFIAEIDEEPDIDFLLARIHDGEIREYNRTVEINHMILNKFPRLINEAFKIRSEFLQATQKDRYTEVVFITGGAGTGKTTLAKKIAIEKNLDYFISSGSNDIMDGYGDEPCLIVDDIRPSVMGLSDLLKMLDPHTASSVKSRYKNKFLNAELVILTTVLDINTFYHNVFSEGAEPINQLKRRCQTYIEVTTTQILIRTWDKKKMNYTDPISYENNLLEEYVPKEELTPEDVENHVKEILPFLKKSKKQPVPKVTKPKKAGIVKVGVGKHPLIPNLSNPNASQEVSGLSPENVDSSSFTPSFPVEYPQKYIGEEDT